MELQLGLALPAHNAVKGFDLSKDAFEPKGMVGSETWSHGCGLGSKNYVKSKRRFDEAFEEIGEVPRTLPLLLWNGQPNEEEDGPKQKKRNSCTTAENDKEENHVVGWPPIKSWRKKLFYQQYDQDGGVDNYRMAKKNSDIGSNSMFVKVKMEGVAIGRKIDLKLFHSYQTLTSTLITMFNKYKKHEKDKARYTLTYQDKEGDWLIAGDVPWQTFMESVQRLEILRRGG